MDRRGFFTALAGTAVGVTTALALPELNLLVPKRTYFLPPLGGWRGNQLLTCGQIVNEALRILSQDLSFYEGDQWNGEQKHAMRVLNDGFAVNTIAIRRPPRYQGLFA